MGPRPARLRRAARPAAGLCALWAQGGAPILSVCTGSFSLCQISTLIVPLSPPQFNHPALFNVI